MKRIYIIYIITKTLHPQAQYNYVVVNASDFQALHMQEVLIFDFIHRKFLEFAARKSYVI
jgi:hypothetical protein